MALAITYDHTFGGLSSPVPLSYLDDDYGNVADGFADLNTFSNFVLDTGAANAYAVTLGAGLTASLANGLTIQMKVANANTTSSTLNFNGTGAKVIRDVEGNPLVGGELDAGAIVQLVYASSITSWMLQTNFVYHEEFTAASANCSGAITDAAIWKVIKNGNGITLTLPAVTGTGAAAPNITFGTALPARFRPSANWIGGSCSLTDNAAQLSAAGNVSVIASTGVISVFRDMTQTTNFTAVASAGLNTQTSVSWTTF